MSVTKNAQPKKFEDAKLQELLAENSIQFVSDYFRVLLLFFFNKYVFLKKILQN